MGALGELGELHRAFPFDDSAADFVTSARDLDQRERVAVDQAIKRALADVVRTVSPDLRIIMSAILSKPARGGALPPHQDVTYTAEPAERSYTIWIPLQPVDAQTGALRMAVGSHHWTTATRGSGPGSRRTIDMSDEAILLSSVTLPAEAGDVIMWDGAVFHSSWPNRSQRDRNVVAATVVRASSTLRYFHIGRDGETTAYAIDENFLDQPSPFVDPPTCYATIPTARFVTSETSAG